VASSPYTVTHGLNTTTPVVEVWDAVTGQVVVTQIAIASANTLQISVATNMPNNANVVVVGSAASPVPISPGDYANKAYVDARTPNLPGAVTSGTTVQSFTDALGDLWVAKNGVNSGAWKRARDVINMRWNRGAGWTTPGTANTWAVLAMDTVVFDVYSLYNSSSGLFTAPVAGIYSLFACIGFNTGATTGVQSGCAIWKNGAVARQTLITNGGSGYAEPQAFLVDRLAAGDTIGSYQASSTASATTYGRGVNETQISIAYLGTG
jgi:hypothetical protein